MRPRLATACSEYGKIPAPRQEAGQLQGPRIVKKATIQATQSRHLQRQDTMRSGRHRLLKIRESQSMNAPSDLSMKNDDVLRVELEVFRREHRDLDEAISAMTQRATSDPLTLQRLKKRKLRLKDLISTIEDRLTPDIIA